MKSWLTKMVDLSMDCTDRMNDWGSRMATPLLLLASPVVFSFGIFLLHLWCSSFPSGKSWLTELFGLLIALFFMALGPVLLIAASEAAMSVPMSKRNWVERLADKIGDAANELTSFPQSLQERKSPLRYVVTPVVILLQFAGALFLFAAVALAFGVFLRVVCALPGSGTELCY